MRTLLALLRDGFRVALLRKPHATPLDIGLGRVIALALLGTLVSALFAWFAVAAPRAFNPWGVQTAAADCFLSLAGIWLLLRVVRREGIFWAVAAWIFAAAILIGLARGFAQLALGHSAEPAAWYALLAAFLLWWLAILWRLARCLGAGRIRALAAAALAFAVAIAPWFFLGPQPLWARDYRALAVQQQSQTDDQGPDFDAEAVMYDQPRLLDDALAKVSSRTPGKVNLYVIAFAGDGNEDVFRNEAEYVERLFGQRFDAAGHVLVLENNPATADTRPLATLTNLTWALDDFAKKMDPAEDVLLLYLTTHGSHDHELLVDLDPLALDQIAPEDLADALATDPPIRHRVVIVNACYSGGFVDALRNPTTLVITSARSDRTSFGCGVDSDITYFGKAFLAQALNRTDSFHRAFELATKSIAGWEDRDKDVHSEPQFVAGTRIAAQLDAWRRGLRLGPPVAFAPADGGKHGKAAEPAADLR